jgi:hypothetical protein
MSSLGFIIVIDGCEALLRFVFASLFSIPHTFHLNSLLHLVCSGLAFITEKIVLLSCLHLVLLHGDGLMEVHGMDGRLCV